MSRSKAAIVALSASTAPLVATITGSTLRPRSVEDKGRIATALRHEIWPLLASGVVRPVVHRTFALGDAAAAHALMESSAHVGKIVLVTAAEAGNG